MESTETWPSSEGSLRGDLHHSLHLGLPHSLHVPSQGHLAHQPVKGAESAESADAAIMNNDPNFTDTIHGSKKEWHI